MKKTMAAILIFLFLGGCMIPSGLHKDTVLMEKPLTYETRLTKNDASSPKDKSAHPTVMLKEGEETDTGESNAFTDEMKGRLLRQQQDNYCFSTLGITEQNLYVEILYALENRIEEMELSTKNPEEIDRIFQCVLLDHPEIFYADGYSFVKYTYADQVRRVTFTGNYIYTERECEEKEKQIRAKVEELLSHIPKEASDYEKVKQVYEAVIQHTEYSINAKDNQNICSVFLENSSVCQGYAKAVQYLLRELSIPATLVVGTVENGEGHAWNLVRIDHDYYHVDATWGDASYTVKKEEDSGENLSGINYDYLCVTTEEIGRTHFIDHVVELPLCNSRQANYYVMEGAYFTEFNEEQLVSLIERYRDEGRERITLKCASKEVYDSMSSILLEDQKIFEYLDNGESSVTYTDSKEQLILTFWLV